MRMCINDNESSHDFIRKMLMLHVFEKCVSIKYEYLHEMQRLRSFE